LALDIKVKFNSQHEFANVSLILIILEHAASHKPCGDKTLQFYPTFVTDAHFKNVLWVVPIRRAASLAYHCSTSCQEIREYPKVVCLMKQ